ncbi:MAG: hypothetical protein DWQ10_18920 [Calditrichaeota bacterium]|nr:MAG: hypothetical protein DWQ10_18920 [Calditrichota bacterium]
MVTDFAIQFENNKSARRDVKLSPSAYLLAWCRLFAQLAENPEQISESMLNDLVASTGVPHNNLKAGLIAQFTGFAKTNRDTFPDIFLENTQHVAIVAAGNIPGIAIAPALLLAAAGCPVIVKMAKADQVLLPWLLRLFEKQFGATGISTGYWQPESEVFDQLLSQAGKVIVFGNDSTISALKMKWGKNIIGFGHKFSIGVLDVDKMEAHDYHAIAKDTALYLQSGCLSPQAFFVKGSNEEVMYHAEKFFTALQFLESEFGEADLDTGTAFQRHALIDQLDMLGVTRFANATGSILVTLDDNFFPERLLGPFVVQFIPFANMKALELKLSALSKWMQGACLYNRNENKPGYKSLLSKHGCTYIAEPGFMQSPPITWENGGFDLIEKIMES